MQLGCKSYSLSPFNIFNARKAEMYSMMSGFVE